MLRRLFLITEVSSWTGLGESEDIREDVFNDGAERTLIANAAAAIGVSASVGPAAVEHLLSQLQLTFTPLCTGTNTSSLTLMPGSGNCEIDQHRRNTRCRLALTP